MRLSRTVFSEQLVDLFLRAGVGKVSDEEAARLCHVFLFLVVLQRPGETSVDFFVLSVPSPFARGGVHTEHLDVTPTLR